MNSPPPVEPSSDRRQMARELRQMFVAYVEQGFTEEQSMDLIAAIIKSHGSGQS